MIKHGTLVIYIIISLFIVGGDIRNTLYENILVLASVATAGAIMFLLIRSNNV